MNDIIAIKMSLSSEEAALIKAAKDARFGCAVVLVSNEPDENDRRMGTVVAIVPSADVGTVVGDYLNSLVETEECPPIMAKVLRSSSIKMIPLQVPDDLVKVQLAMQDIIATIEAEAALRKAGKA